MSNGVIFYQVRVGKEIRKYKEYEVSGAYADAKKNNSKVECYLNMGNSYFIRVR